MGILRYAVLGLGLCNLVPGSVSVSPKHDEFIQTLTSELEAQIDADAHTRQLSQIIIAPESYRECRPQMGFSDACDRYLLQLMKAGTEYFVDSDDSEYSCPTQFPSESARNFGCLCGQFAPQLLLEYAMMPLCIGQADLRMQASEEVDTAIKAASEAADKLEIARSINQEYDPLIEQLLVEVDILRNCDMQWLFDECNLKMEPDQSQATNNEKKKKKNASSGAAHVKLSAAAAALVAALHYLA